MIVRKRSGEFTEGALHIGVEAAIDDRMLGILSGIVGCFELVEQDRDRQAVEAVSTVAVTFRVTHDRQQPCSRITAVKALDRSEGADQCFLHQIFRIDRLARKGASDAIQQFHFRKQLPGERIMLHVPWWPFVCQRDDSLGVTYGVASLGCASHGDHGRDSRSPQALRCPVHRFRDGGVTEAPSLPARAGTSPWRSRRSTCRRG